MVASVSSSQETTPFPLGSVPRKHSYLELSSGASIFSRPTIWARPGAGLGMGLEPPCGTVVADMGRCE